MARRTAYLVQRTAWDHMDWEPAWVRVTGSMSLQGAVFDDDRGLRTVPVATLPFRAAAEAEARRLESEARGDYSPFWFGFDYDDVTGLPSAELAGRVAALGVSPPPDPPDDEDYGTKTAVWSAWWDEQSPTWTPGQRDAVWELFDKLHFYEVIEIELED